MENDSSVVHTFAAMPRSVTASGDSHTCSALLKNAGDSSTTKIAEIVITMLFAADWRSPRDFFAGVRLRPMPSVRRERRACFVRAIMKKALVIYTIGLFYF